MGWGFESPLGHTVQRRERLESAKECAKSKSKPRSWLTKGTRRFCLWNKENRARRASPPWGTEFREEKEYDLQRTMIAAGVSQG